VCVSWQDATAYSDWLARKTHRKVRLPSEAEFEYAARASSSGSRYWGSDELGACRYANVLDQTALKFIPGTQNWAALVHPCSDGFAFTSPVGSFRPNRWGLYDMLGNVWEWTQDCYHDSYLGAPAQGTAWTSGDCNFRVDRGGT
jgi:formylglycine-generating enzyme required for sulfatase activity